MDPDSINVMKKIVIDLLCIFAVGIPLLLLHIFVDPFKRGFFCNDDNIKYPYRDSTVTNSALYIVGLCLPISVMILVEIARWHRGEDGTSYTLCGKRIPLWLSNCYKSIGVFGFGAACCQLITNVGKYTIGRLRPHFLEVCAPNIDCFSPLYQNHYIDDYTCRGTNGKLIKEARLSFPSGHSSFSAYAMIYLVIYLQCRFNWRGSHLAKHVFQFVCFVMTWGTALSRVTNYKHHWSDVTVGLILGISVAVLNIFLCVDSVCCWSSVYVTDKDLKELILKRPAVFVSDLFKKNSVDRQLEDRIDLTSTSQALNAKDDATVNL